MDEKIAEAEREKMRLTAALEQLNINEAESKKVVEDLRANVKKLKAENEAYLQAKSNAKKEKKLEEGTSIPTLELDSSQENLTQSDQRLMDIQGMEVYLQIFSKSLFLNM